MSSRSEYARMEVIFISRQARAMRTAISPRFGMMTRSIIRSANAKCRMQNAKWPAAVQFCILHFAFRISSLRPRRLLLPQKRPHPLLPFFAHAALGDFLDRVRHRLIECVRGHVCDQLLAFADGLRSRWHDL